MQVLRPGHPESLCCLVSPCIRIFSKHGQLFIMPPTWHCHSPSSITRSTLPMLRLQSPLSPASGSEYLPGWSPTGFPSFCHLHSPAMFITRQVRVVFSPGETCGEDGYRISSCWLWVTKIYKSVLSFSSSQFLPLNNNPNKSNKQPHLSLRILIK